MLGGGELGRGFLQRVRHGFRNRFPNDNSVYKMMLFLTMVFPTISIVCLGMFESSISLLCTTSTSSPSPLPSSFRPHLLPLAPPIHFPSFHILPSTFPPHPLLLFFALLLPLSVLQGGGMERTVHSAKEPCMFRKRPLHIPQKSPVFPAKEPCIFCKRALYIPQTRPL